MLQIRQKTKPLMMSFLLKLAFRDSRKNRSKLALFMSSIILGVAALVAINSFNYNLRHEIDRESATLLGADLAASGNRPADDAVLKVLDSLPSEKATEKELLSMAYIPKTEETQFIRLKALEGNFPFYGKIKTTPEAAASSFRMGQNALVDESVMMQHDLVIGDSIKLGNTMFAIVGKLQGSIGSVGVANAVAPAIYINMASLDSTGLLQPGSLVNYAYYYKLKERFDIDQWKASRKLPLQSESLRIETIKDRKESLNQAFGFLNYFLNLVAIVALLLGCIGVASSVLIYVKSKTNAIALLRCIGLKSWQAFAVYFIQIFVLGVVGVLLGVGIGVLIQSLLPLVLKDFLPVNVEIIRSPKAMIEGFSFGLLITILFSLLPLVGIQHISPLHTLRTAVEEKKPSKDLLRWIIVASIFVVMTSFLWILTASFVSGIAFVLAIAAAYGLLNGVSILVLKLMRSSIPSQAGFVIRQGLSNLFRPDNQTQTIIVTIGMGTTVLATLLILQSILLNNVSLMDAGQQPNMILYGIESNQIDSLKEMTMGENLPIIQEVPVVTMKIEAWKGKTKQQWLADSTSNTERWAANREARVSYRDTIADDEKLVKGRLRTYQGNNDSIFISLGTTFAQALGIDVGDEVIFNVQGTRLVTYVGSLREIQFRNLSTRFFIVFPNGVLEKAPQFLVLVTKTPDNKTMSTYRTKVVKTFPNVSVIDLTTILQSVNDILKKVSFIIQFMALFSLLTGLVVLISSLSLSKFQRLKESILLRTIGASRSQILKINATEYAFLGLLSAGTGIILALIASYAIVTFQLELDFDLSWTPVLTILFLISMITLCIGMFNSWDVVRNPPLEVLRKEQS